MAVDPLGRSGVPHPDMPRTQESRRGEAVGGAQGAPAPSSDGILQDDTLELSPEALLLAQGEPVPGGTLTAEQMDLISQRLTSGSYDNPEVTATVAERLAQGIPIPMGWGGAA